MKKKFYLVAVMILAALVIVSCSPENLQDGKTANTKKQMTSTEYSENRGAIKSVSVVEAYAIANQDKATPSARGTSGEYKLPFKETTNIETSDIISKLDTRIENAKTDAEKTFYNSLKASIQNAPKVEVKTGSYVNFSVDENGIALISSLDITIVIDGKTIEIEKDADDKWKIGRAHV